MPCARASLAHPSPILRQLFCHGREVLHADQRRHRYRNRFAATHDRIRPTRHLRLTTPWAQARLTRHDLAFAESRLAMIGGIVEDRRHRVVTPVCLTAG